SLVLYEYMCSTLFTLSLHDALPILPSPFRLSGIILDEMVPVAVDDKPKAIQCSNLTIINIRRLLIAKYKPTVIIEKIIPYINSFLGCRLSMILLETKRPNNIPMINIPAAKPPILSEAWYLSIVNIVTVTINVSWIKYIKKFVIVMKIKSVDQSLSYIFNTVI